MSEQLTGLNETLKQFASSLEGVDLDEAISLFDRIFEPKTELTLLIIYLTLLTLGFVSNGIIIILFCLTNFNQREPRSLLFINLALSDAIYCLAFCPFTLHNILRKSWPFNELLCKIVPTFQGILVFVSSGIVTTISVQRACIITGICTNRINIISSNKSQQSASKSKTNSTITLPAFSSSSSSSYSSSSLSITPLWPSSASCSSLSQWLRSDIVLVTLIWIISILLSSPIFIYQTISHIELTSVHTITICGELWPRHGRTYYTLALLLIQWVCPLVTMTICHHKVDTFLRRHIQTRVRLMCFNDMDSKQKGNLFYSKLVSNILNKRDIKDKLRRNSKVTRTLFKNTIIFGSIWLPINLTNIYSDLADQSTVLNQLSPTTIYFTQAISQTIAILSPICNAYLYFWSNTNTRKQVKKYYLFKRLTKSNCFH